MDSCNVESGLQCLRNLYGLLQQSDANNLTQALDEKTRVFLKAMLDSKTQKLLAKQSKILEEARSVMDLSRSLMTKPASVIALKTWKRRPRKETNVVETTLYVHPEWKYIISKKRPRPSSLSSCTSYYESATQASCSSCEEKSEKKKKNKWFKSLKKKLGSLFHVCKV